MKILLVYPKYPDTFWSFKHALKFVSKKASFPPLGLLTVAALLPKEWDKRLIDMNANDLSDQDISWADFVFISAMSIQSSSTDEVIQRCKNLKAKIVGGGPLFTSSQELYENLDHLVLNEAELTLPRFLEDLAKGVPQKKYTTGDWAEITTTPLPLWELVKMNNYSSMNIQYSRGCPYDCDFCDITVLYGRRPRTKTKEQVIAELDALYFSGWRGPVFFVDDNFIGNKGKLKKEILPAIAGWMDKRKRPFFLNTEASINLADDDMLMNLMVKAGFEAVFIGIESPNEESLIECNKTQNRNRDLISSIKKIQDFGLEVQGGFIVGFDNDPPSIFEKLTNFIQESGIVTAMVGLLNAPKGTKLEKRLENEGRLLKDFTGNNTDFSINFIPQMSHKALLDGYKKILDTIYSPKYYYERVTRFLKDFKPKKKVFHLNLSYILALFKSMLKLGVLGEERIYYWKLFFWSLFRKPQLFSLAILFTIYGFHFRRISSSLS
ncbi:MAG: B12-binding domain-containing radical SAM protein [Ignavibacteriaceae bacterium]